MGRQYNNEFGEWLAGEMQSRHITSTRQVRARTGVSHTTVDDILTGQQPRVETAIRIGVAYGLSAARALHLAGHDEIADVLDTPSAPAPAAQELTYEPLTPDQAELISYYDGFPRHEKDSFRGIAKYIYKAHNPDDPPDEGRTHGKRAE